ncbi:hypothetical protein QCA50_000144 [Cerrena zonata]|uniref:F-box domain-containing protein n=1 Tax=Cerrena zonata TaxID=2478898 RepID=A0AAW0GXE3_9APHY
MQPCSTVYRVIYNMDILYNIIQASLNRYKFDWNTPNLARLARVCRAFHDPALDQLWKRLEDFTPVFALCDAIMLIYDPKAYQAYLFGNGKAPELDSPKVHWLHKLCKGTPLFPSLNDLNLSVWPLSVAEANLLFSPSLHKISSRKGCTQYRTICVSKLTPVQQEQMCIHLLVKRCPGLQVFEGHLLQSSGATRLFDPIFNLAKLTTFRHHLPPPTLSDKRGQWLEKASRMKHLSKFSFSLIDFPDDAIPQLDLGPFTCLDQLHIEGSVPMLSLIFSSMSNHLTYLSIQTDIGEAFSGMRKCFQMLADNVGRQLSVFKMDPTTDDLMCHLEEVWITMPCSITDRDITILAKAWPNLRRIEIGKFPSSEVESSIQTGFRALIALAVWCPYLQLIRLNLDLNDPPPLNKVPDVKHNLQWLGTQYISSDDEGHLQKIAAVIHHLFPHIFSGTDFDDPDDTDTNWLAVLSLVEGLQNAANLHP